MKILNGELEKLEKRKMMILNVVMTEYSLHYVAFCVSQSQWKKKVIHLKMTKNDVMEYVKVFDEKD